MPHHDRIAWWEPYAATRRASWAEMRSLGLSRPGPWVRIAVIATLLGSAISIGAWLAFPVAALPWVRIAATIVLGGPMILAVAMGMAVLAPRRIDVRDKGVLVQSGGQPTYIPRDRLDRLEVRGDHGSGATLILAYRTRKGRGRSLEIAIAPSVDLESLRALARQLSSAGDRGARRATENVLPPP